MKPAKLGAALVKIAGRMFPGRMATLALVGVPTAAASLAETNKRLSRVRALEAQGAHGAMGGGKVLSLQEVRGY